MTIEPHVYSDYMRDRTGWFFGLTGIQLTILACAGVPVWLTINAAAWSWLLVWVPAWAISTILSVVPVRGWTSAQWVLVLSRHAWGSRRGWTTWRAPASQRHVEHLGRLDLPGILSATVIHEGPLMPTTHRPMALIEHRAARTWAITARVAHPGIGLTEPETRNRYGAGLTELCEAATRTELVDLIALQVRTIPDDGAERQHWVAAHRDAVAPDLARRVNDLLESQLLPAAVRTEAFVTAVVSESHLPREARRARGADARASVLYGVAGELQSRLLGAMGCTEVTWLDAKSLAVAIRTGFEPGDRALLKSAELMRLRQPGARDDVPMCAVGPATAAAHLRQYDHGGWSSVSTTLVLPEQGALLGALAPVLTPSAAGERRSLTVYVAPIAQRAADRLTSREEMSALTGAELRRRSGRLERAKDRRAAARVRSNDEKLSRGRALMRPSAVVTTTVLADQEPLEHARRLEAAVRLAGFVPMRLDGAQDAAFIAGSIPLGLSH